MSVGELTSTARCPDGVTSASWLHCRRSAVRNRLEQVGAETTLTCPELRAKP